MGNVVPLTSRNQRMLAAIVVTDAVGFSASMSQNEEQALARINRDLKTINEIVDFFEGKVLKTTGDGVLTYFLSAIQAVACALEIQKTFSHGLALGKKQDHFAHRIGIHLGDVFINESDIMGTGVNIAARLEATCEPGGICVSQVVYDVVKSRLDFNARFLGPLHLKNIYEEVPAYQIHLADIPLPDPQDSAAHPSEEITQSLSSIPAPHSASPQSLDKVAQTLENNPQNLRIKKLLFAACQMLWENDPAVLAQFPLQSLLVSFIQRNPSLEHCKASLYKVVATLNRKADYVPIAESILEQLPYLYQSAQHSHKPTAATPDAPTSPIPKQQNLGPVSHPVTTDLASLSQDATIVTSPLLDLAYRIQTKQFSSDPLETLYQQVANGLDQAPESIRIKKVLYCLCHKVWENDAHRLTQLDTSILVEKIHRSSPIPQDLKYRLRHLLRYINRRTQYAPVADTIFQTFQVLYATDCPKELGAIVGIGDVSEGSDSMTRLSSNKTPINPDATIAISHHPLNQSASEPQDIFKDRSDLFELRFDILKVCNPLRAKILLLSVLKGPFSNSPQDWSMLRAKTLDDLLREVFDYCPTFDDLEGKLSILTHCLDDVAEYAAVATGLAKAIAPYYPSKVNKSQGQRVQAKSSTASKSVTYAHADDEEATIVSSALLPMKAPIPTPMKATMPPVATATMPSIATATMPITTTVSNPVSQRSATAYGR
jgi:adenylate cyclase